jgi:oligoendopeptidase F
LQGFVSRQEKKISFFTDEILNMKEADLLSRMGAPALAPYAPWLTSQRADIVDAGAKLSGKSEKAAALYDRVMRGLRVRVRGENMTITQAENVLDLPLSPAERGQIRAAIGKALAGKEKTLARAYNDVARANLEMMRLGGHDHPHLGFHNEERISGEQSDAMSAEVRRAYRQVSRRFFEWKEQKYARGESAAGGTSGDQYSWEDARRIAIQAEAEVSPELGKIAARFFDEAHIDAKPRPGKAAGWMMLSVAPGILPFIAAQYEGTADHVAGIAHEVGHGAQQIVSDQKRPFLSTDPLTPVSEIGSISNEMRAHGIMQAEAKTPRQKRDLLSDQVNLMVRYGCEQFAMHEYEVAAHKLIEKGPVSAERLSEAWMKSRRRLMGKACRNDAYERHGWMLREHFFEMSFYVYCYTPAMLTVNVMHDQWHAAKRKGPVAREAYRRKYEKALASGMSRNVREVAELFGHDAETRKYWKRGVDIIKRDMEKLFRLDKALQCQEKAAL